MLRNFSFSHLNFLCHLQQPAKSLRFGKEFKEKIMRNAFERCNILVNKTIMCSNKNNNFIRIGHERTNTYSNHAGS